MKKTLYTNQSLFNKIIELLKEKGLLLDILDYHLAEHKEMEIRSCEWDCTGDLRFGGSEGIYLDIYAEGNLGIGEPKVRLGVFKTLREDREAFRQMARLQADFIWETIDFVNNNLDDFTWTGYDVDFYHNGIKTTGYTTPTMDSANNLMKRNLKYEWEEVIITNNETCKEIKFSKSEIEEKAFE